jgi:CubicO group peptidase (beta-lactamase class C family)
MALLGSMTGAFAQSTAAYEPVRSFYEAGLKENGIVGSSLALVRGGQVVFRDNYGLMSRSPDRAVNDDTTYHWASITKTFTGIAIMQLRDRGLLKLDDPVVKYVPELAAVHDPYGPVAKITIGQLMSHSAGFRSPTWPWRDKEWQPFEPMQWSQIVAMLPYTEVEFEPGSKFSYSNLGVVFLGEIIERLSGDPFEVYMEKNVLRPLGMDRSYYDRSPYYLVAYRSHSWEIHDGKLVEDPFDFNTGITRSNGGLNAPIGDMLKYIDFLLGDPAHPDRYDVILKRASLEEMWKPVLPISDQDDAKLRAGATESVATSFFDYSDRGVRLVGHTGTQNSFFSRIEIEPATHSAMIVAYNTDTGNTRAWDIELLNFLVDHFFTAK